MLAKALECPADELVADLEDAVAADAKARARALLAGWLAARPDAAPAVAVRVNPLAGPWGEQDVIELVTAAAGRAVDSLVIPKVEAPSDIATVAGLLDRLGTAADGVRLQALIETAPGLLHVEEIAAGGARLDALILGYADLAASLGRGRSPRMGEPESWWYAQEKVLVAARAFGLQAIDGPYLEIRDDAGLRRRAAHARELGFDGKWAVHPGQLEVINEAFTPAPDELARARHVLEALARAQGRGAIELRGEMLDEASRRQALGVLARAGVAADDGAPR